MDKKSQIKSDLLILKNYLWLFDRAFFYGLMEKHINLGITELYSSCLAYVAWFNDCEYFKVWLTPIEGPSGERLVLFLESLLHEITHAFLKKYGCCFDGCATRPEAQGRTGHGEAWCRALRAIGPMVKKWFGMSLDIDLEVHWMREFREDGNKAPAVVTLPSEGAMERLQMDKQHILKVKQRLEHPKFITGGVWDKAGSGMPFLEMVKVVLQRYVIRK